MEVFADERPVEREPVNIHVVLDHVKRLAQSGFARHIRFVEDYDPSLPPVLRQSRPADPGLSQSGEERRRGDRRGRRRRRNSTDDRVPSRRSAVGAGQQDPRVAAARILRQGQRSGRAGGSPAASVRSVRDHQAERHRAWVWHWSPRSSATMAGSSNANRNRDERSFGC